MDRAEAAGLGVATAGHLALLAALSFGLAAARLPVPKSDPIEVSFVDEVGLESAAPTPVAEAPAAAARRWKARSRRPCRRRRGSARPAAGARAPHRAPAPAPAPNPRPAPRRPRPSRHTEPAPPKPAPSKPARSEAVDRKPKPPIAPTGRSQGLLNGVATGQATAGRRLRPPPSTSAQARASIARGRIRRQLKPAHWNAPTGAGASRIKLRLNSSSIAWLADGASTERRGRDRPGRASNRPHAQRVHRRWPIAVVRLAARRSASGRISTQCPTWKRLRPMDSTRG